MAGTIVNSYNLYLDSRQAQVTSSSNGGNFIVNLGEAKIQCENSQQIRLTLYNFHIQKVWPTVNSFNNRFSFNDIDGTIAEGDYINNEELNQALVDGLQNTTDTTAFLNILAKNYWVNTADTGFQMNDFSTWKNIYYQTSSPGASYVQIESPKVAFVVYDTADASTAPSGNLVCKYSNGDSFALLGGNRQNDSSPTQVAFNNVNVNVC